MTEAKIRLYLDQPLAPGQALALDEAQANYLFNVMRLGKDAVVKVFNGRDGEWLARVEHAAKRSGILRAEALSAPLVAPPDLWLIFAPIKKARCDFIVEKAVELGVARLLPVQTRYTNERFREDKAQAHAIEAAEQCEATFVPPVDDLRPLERVLKDWDPARRILWADEGLQGQAALLQASPGPWAVLIGPEGGFAPEERERLRSLPFVTPVSLGPRILRADTAAVAALTLWQANLGDWR
ncbi:16S rRNA (uracil(1498)-N(3))-methyltransferase [Stagnihabitans tardus]|uniref:Ribosomal RNA small subunit methyltransferase E n=1 Tax=Stagnihabitans tardus TaxID=2699202 RepID=A0AAE4YAV5_9RHOB|nr:16S rRNA (uracil(1498)-N(3))-methyltransferase [Stagnihabitans tardus]NBZ86894.1 16S rRNA (uracil(1498)-N(3))-methyltransferase [Stagnihabitans tardus]